MFFSILDSTNKYNNYYQYESKGKSRINSSVTATGTGGVSTSSADTDQWSQNTNRESCEGKMP